MQASNDWDEVDGSFCGYGDSCIIYVCEHSDDMETCQICFEGPIANLMICGGVLCTSGFALAGRRLVRFFFGVVFINSIQGCTLHIQF